MTETTVKLYIYDLSKGMAKNMSRIFLGRQIDGIWHTGVVVHGTEFYFGGSGIESCHPCGTMLGNPMEIRDMGTTEIPRDTFMEYLQELSTTTFRPECYHLLNHNCNTFSSEISQFLTGHDIPAEITNLPAEVMSTPLGQMLQPMLEAMSVQPSGGHQMFTDPNRTAKPNASSSAAEAGATKATNTSNNATGHSHATGSNGDHTGDDVTGPCARANAKLRHWAHNDDERDPVTFTQSVSEMFTEANTSMTRIQQVCPASVYNDINTIVDCLSKPTEHTLSFPHIQMLASHITNTALPDTTRHFCLNLLAQCSLKRAMLDAGIGSSERAAGNTSIFAIVHSYTHLPACCKSATIRFVANTLSCFHGYTSLLYTDMDVVPNILIEGLLDDSMDMPFHRFASSAIHNLSLYCAEGWECFPVASAVLHAIHQRRLSTEIVEMLLATLLRVMNNCDEVAPLAKTMELDWSTLAGLSPKATRLTAVITSAMS